jgi:hypothetical protein
MGMPVTRGSGRKADNNRRSEAFSGGYYWFPTRNNGAVNWEVLTCHELGFDAEVGHVDLWPSVLDRLSSAWGRDPRIIKLSLGLHYTGLPRGRITQLQRRFLVFHGDNAPVGDWLPRVIRRFDIDRRSVRAVFDEHETRLPEDRGKVNEILGLGPSEREDR